MTGKVFFGKAFCSYMLLPLVSFGKALFTGRLGKPTNINSIYAAKNIIVFSILKKLNLSE